MQNVRAYLLLLWQPKTLNVILEIKARDTLARSAYHIHAKDSFTNAYFCGMHFFFLGAT